MARMDGRRPTGIMYVNTDADAPHKRDEYHRWYLDVHFGDVTRPEIFVNALMFRNAQDPLPDGELPFLAMYETFWADVEQAITSFQNHVDGMFASQLIHAGTVGGMFAIYRQHGIFFATERRRRTQSLIAVHIDAVDGREEELRRWYVDTHVPETVNLGICHTGSFSERVGDGSFSDATRPDQPRFLAMYESDIGDPVALGGMLAEKLPPDSLPEFVQLRSASFFYRTSP